MKDKLIENAPIGSKAFCQENGWMCKDLFVNWLKHFVHYTRTSKDNKALLLLDGCNCVLFSCALHSSCPAFGCWIFCTPPQTYYGQEIQSWLKQNPGRVVSQIQVAGLFTKAYLKAATRANAVHAYAKTGKQ
ncbi:dde superfamily endonuclease [Holotrichia oblita]|uniref:Dde superfamily endonuclease n=1 Tax=Holotrichia oblita TaxID=644536 RepID=A0ACB9TAS7_HOLOL|nr:dde superfamily endonuclease [Holotrichia oblita]